MSKYLKATALTLGVGLLAAPVLAGQYGLGRPALPEEIAAWNLDIHPDGSGLPEGSGAVEDGEMLFSENCASCHGDFAEGVDKYVDTNKNKPGSTDKPGSSSDTLGVRSPKSHSKTIYFVVIFCIVDVAPVTVTID